MSALRTVLLAFILILPCLAGAQNLFLFPSIGLSELPNDADPVCTIPTYLGNYDVSGLQAGDTLADFTLYDLNGDSLNLAVELQKGKPLLMVTGSYTCPVFRNHVAVINQVVETFGNAISVVVIYTVEAHPEIDISPYFGYVNTTNANQQAGILYRQPTTYGERKAIVSDMLGSMSINAPVFIDGPCNQWWSHYGPAPQNAYLVNTNGTVFVKHPWFDKFPDDIFCDIDSLLGNVGSCGNVANGSFQFYMTGDTLAVDTPWATLSVHGELVNPSASPVNIKCVKLQKNLPAGWATSLCTDACYPSTVDTLVMQLQPGDTQSFTFYFYTDGVASTGNVRVGFRNENNANNKFAVRLYGETDENFVGKVEELNAPSIRVFPNPSEGRFWVENESADEGGFVLTDLSGRQLLTKPLRKGRNLVEMEGISPGIYLWQVGEAFGKILIR
ncbi:MAG: T9SS type A sorting domain-containing protein [Bacteroidia bacterium]|nr:T9SS type A sorting domain-containing protein [Bacteroidia bacterium]